MACLRKRRERWIIDFYDTSGKRRWKTLPKGTTKGKARDSMRDIEDQLAKGVYLPEKRIPLFKTVAADWLEQKKLNVRASTWEMYRGQIKESAIKVLPPEHISNFFGAVENPKYKTLFMLAVLSGARQGELLGLKWTDVDWINNQIHIQRSFNTHTWYKPKTKTSYRRIDLGLKMMKHLEAWRLACPPNDLDLIFPSEKGSPLDANNVVTRYFRKAMEKAGLPRLRFHDLRHTYASLLIEQGENIKYIQRQIGHSSPTVTLNVYAHLMKPVNQASAKRLESSIF